VLEPLGGRARIDASLTPLKTQSADTPKPHPVPLTSQATDIIRSIPRLGRYVVPSDHAEGHEPFLPNALTRGNRGDVALVPRQTRNSLPPP
jgi:hypothetical protein